MASFCSRLLVIRLIRPLLCRKLSSASTVDPNEITTFENLSGQWWDEGGEFKPLHSMNTLRVPFIRNGLINSGAVSKEASTKPRSLSGLRILDVGCGGGILSEPLARLGAEVTGLDASAGAVSAARLHAALQPGLALSFEHGALEGLAGRSFDVVVASELLEHVASARGCLQLCAQLLEPGGSLFVTTLNRTLLSWLGGVALAENVLGLVPRGTHSWAKFVSPGELRRILADYELTTRLVHGMAYNPASNDWRWSSWPAINYALHAVKLKE